MRYLRLVILISIFGFGLNTTVFAQVCCPAGSVQDGRRCVNTTTQRTSGTVPCRPGRPPGSSGGVPGAPLVSSAGLGGDCEFANRTPETRAAATNQCVAALAANANLFRCLFESNADRDEDVRTGLSCKDRQAALANQCRARCASFAASESSCRVRDTIWQENFGDVDGNVYGFARIELCGPPLRRAVGPHERLSWFSPPLRPVGPHERPSWFRFP
jgi:hypothetical protein